MSPAQRPTVQVQLADLECPRDQADILRLLQYYAEHPMGRDAALPDEVVDRVLTGLISHPTSLVFLARLDGSAVGMATCFIGFSTFLAKQLINIHDLVVAQRHQQCGIGSDMLDAIYAYAQRADYCAVTLEVMAANPARQLYIKKGFLGLEATGGTDQMLFGKRQVT